jgi:Lipase (class 3)
MLLRKRRLQDRWFVPPPSEHVSIPRRPSTRAVLLGLTLVGTATSLATRHWRQQHLDTLERVVLTEVEATELDTTLERAALMSALSTSEELARIRQWHRQRGYLGGIVLRDVTKRVPDEAAEEAENAEAHQQWPDVWPFLLGEARMQQMQKARRECYYIYYEITDAGQHVQQIFVRGTSLWIDVITCLQTVLVYDEELQCRVHWGFRQQAQRILQDILPLLSQDANVELCGHSLGGAVASLLAMKLAFRGYKVTKLVTIGEPAYLSFSSASSARQRVSLLLPPQQVRIENDCDLVPYLPPFASHVGPKLWLTRRPWASQETQGLWVPDPGSWWTESLILNVGIPELVARYRSAHRIPTYRRYVLSTVSATKDKSP